MMIQKSKDKPLQFDANLEKNNYQIVRKTFEKQESRKGDIVKFNLNNTSNKIKTLVLYFNI